MRGAYEIKGEEHLQVGFLIFNEKGRITGLVMERGARYRKIRGLYEGVRGRLSLSVQSPSGRETIRYYLQKTRDKTNTAGRYTGGCFIRGSGGRARVTLDSKV